MGKSLVIRHVEVVRRFLQCLIDLVTKYAETVLDDVVTLRLEGHIVQTWFLQKQTIAPEWECLCFLQLEITQLQKWMVSDFPSTAKHQWKVAQVEIISNTLEGKLYKLILNYCIITRTQVKSTCYRDVRVRILFFTKIRRFSWR